MRGYKKLKFMNMIKQTIKIKNKDIQWLTHNIWLKQFLRERAAFFNFNFKIRLTESLCHLIIMYQLWEIFQNFKIRILQFHERAGLLRERAGFFNFMIRFTWTCRILQFHDQIHRISVPLHNCWSTFEM